MKKVNRGSAVIEMTLLVPILFGCIYFFIMTMLYMVRQAQDIEQVSDCVYESSRKMMSDARVTTYKQGNMKITKCEEDSSGYKILIELRVDDSDPVKNLRRWQLVTDTVH